MSSRRRKIARGGRPRSKRKDDKVRSQIQTSTMPNFLQVKAYNDEIVRQEMHRQMQANQASLRDVMGEDWSSISRYHGAMYEQYRRTVEADQHDLLTQDGHLFGLGSVGAYASYKPDPMTVLEVAREVESYVSRQGHGTRPQDLRVRRNFEVNASVWVFADALDMEKLTKELKRIYQLPVVECTEGVRAGSQVELKVRLQTQGFREDFERQRVRPLPLDDGEVELHFT